MKSLVMVEVKKPLTWLLIAVPIAVVLEIVHADPLLIFAIAAIAIVPLAGFMGRATEHISEDLGPAMGGLLNATLGNAAELIIALMLLAKGPEMYPLVKASITGSIIGNVLLVLGLSIFAGGLKHRVQKFNRAAASMGSTLLTLAAVGLVVPALFHYLHGNRTTELKSLSDEIAVILALVYVASLVFSMMTHKHLFSPDEGESEPVHLGWSRTVSVIVLLVSTGGVILMSEFLVGSVEHTAKALGLNSVFVGVIVVAVVGNAAEHSTAILMAYKNKMDVAFHIAVGSGTQIALFVAPVLVFASHWMGHSQSLDLHFSAMETAAVLLSVSSVALVSQDGESHWMEGVMLLAVYTIFGLVFYHLPMS